eukprot:TRINITY_DN9441_c0_g1_i1.p1 TRINITY_DN9441_c0_g1~~TRINITY_DN9441_c0_g1_i1.p1  ORF type:complete len:390 (+),score=52.63 TRINITY_DN9441_c0_g1_i1:96-1265(+)
MQKLDEERRITFEHIVTLLTILDENRLLELKQEVDRVLQTKRSTQDLLSEEQLWPSQAVANLEISSRSADVIDIPDDIDAKFFGKLASKRALAVAVHSYAGRLRNTSAADPLARSIAANDYALPRSFSRYLDKATSKAVRSAMLEALLAQGSIDAHVFCVLGSAGALNWIIGLLSSRAEDEETIVPLLLTCLAMICQAGPLPDDERRKLDADLVEHLLDLALEQQYNTDDSVLNGALLSLLSINWQLPAAINNLVMKALANRKEISNLGNAIVMLMNREEGRSREACLKFMRDIFSQAETADFFFTNDFHVLLEILTRQFQDLGNGDPLQLLYLEVFYQLFHNHPGYGEDQFKRDEIVSMFRSILEQTLPEEPTYQMAEKIVLDQPFFA